MREVSPKECEFTCIHIRILCLSNHIIFQIEDDIDKELKMNSCQKGGMRTNRYLNKFSFFILGCIAAVVMGLNSKSVNSSGILYEISDNFVKNMSVVVATALDLMDQPQKPHVKTILLELS